MLTRIFLRVRLNLWLFMHNIVWSLFFGMVLASPLPAQYPQVVGQAIVSPRPGDVLQGAVIISGSSDINGFLSAEISFTFEEDTTGTWFQISTNNQPVYNNTLATWDTTVITDGNYVLRLRVYLTDGTFRESVVSGLRVRNYTPVETPTPTIAAPEATPLPTLIPTVTPFPTPTVLPRNPATLAPLDISASILFGGLAAICAFVIVGIYLWFRRK